MAFGEMVRARRKELGIGLNEMAERLDISPGYLSRIERNLDRPPSDEVLERAAAILGIPLDTLCIEAERLPPDMRKDIGGVVLAYRRMRALRGRHGG